MQICAPNHERVRFSRRFSCRAIESWRAEADARNVTLTSWIEEKLNRYRGSCPRNEVDFTDRRAMLSVRLRVEDVAHWKARAERCRLSTTEWMERVLSCGL